RLSPWLELLQPQAKRKRAPTFSISGKSPRATAKSTSNSPVWPLGLGTTPPPGDTTKTQSPASGRAMQSKSSAAAAKLASSFIVISSNEETSLPRSRSSPKFRLLLVPVRNRFRRSVAPDREYDHEHERDR